MTNTIKVTVIIPAKNEERGLACLLPELLDTQGVSDVLVIDDGSIDGTAAVCKKFNVNVISSPYSMGNGAAIKAGARVAKGDVLIFMDADGQHNPKDIPKLLERYKQGYDMVVGCRDSASQAGLGRWAANTLYNKLASWIVGREIKDLTSGFRVVNAKKFKSFLYLLPNGFSYPTTVTMAFFRSGYSVYYEDIVVEKRLGKSHINIVRDGLRFLLIIMKVGTLYSPLKLFFPISSFLLLSGSGLYLYNLVTTGRFTNMSMLLLMTSLIIFMIGLVSEQITALLYKDSE